MARDPYLMTTTFASWPLLKDFYSTSLFYEIFSKPSGGELIYALTSIDISVPSLRHVKSLSSLY